MYPSHQRPLDLSCTACVLRWSQVRASVFLKRQRILLKDFVRIQFYLHGTFHMMSFACCLHVPPSMLCSTIHIEEKAGFKRRTGDEAC